MATTWDWSPVAQGLQGLIGNYVQQKQYNDLLQNLLGPGVGTPTPQPAQGLIGRLLHPQSQQQAQPQSVAQAAPMQMNPEDITGDQMQPSKQQIGFQPAQGGGLGEILKRMMGGIGAQGGGQRYPMDERPGSPYPPGRFPMDERGPINSPQAGGGSPLGGIDPRMADLFRRLPPQIGMPLLLQTMQSQLAPKAHTFSSTRDGQIYDTSTGQMIGTSVAQRDADALKAQNAAEAGQIGGTMDTGNIGAIDQLPLEGGQREALRNLVQTGGTKGIETYRDVVKGLATKGAGDGITTKEVNIGDQTKIGQFKDGNLVGYVKGPDGNDIVAPRYKPTAGSVNVSLDDPEVQSYATNILNGNATLTNVPVAKRGAVSRALEGMGKGAYSPLAEQRLTLAASRIATPYKKLPQFELTANGLPYLQRIQAALEVPGSVSDQDLLDSLTKLNTAGNAVTDAQVKLITEGKSYADMYNTFMNRFKNGGVLSPNQRDQIQKIAKAIYANYKKGYQPVYDEAASKLKQAGIPEQFWGLPDLNKLSAVYEQDKAPQVGGGFKYLGKEP